MIPSLISPARMDSLLNHARSILECVPGDFVEVGVYQGGSLELLAQVVKHRRILGFDTFTGMPDVDPIKDLHRAGDFADTDFPSLVRAFSVYPNVRLVQGLFPASAEGVLDQPIAFAHVDCDIYSSVRDCCRYLWPKMAIGGVMMFDDYIFPTCPEAKQAVDEFVAGLLLPTEAGHLGGDLQYLIRK